MGARLTRKYVASTMLAIILGGGMACASRLAATPSPTPVPTATPEPTAIPLPTPTYTTVAPIPTPTPNVLKEYTEGRADGSVWLVRGWSDGRYENLRQLEPSYTPTATPGPRTPIPVPSATPTVILGHAISAGRYVIVEAPPTYISHLERQLPVFDSIYESLHELTGFSPFGGQKVRVTYDPYLEPLIPGGSTVLAGNPILISRGAWGEDHFWVIGHEMSHNFTLEWPDAMRRIIIPYPAFAEGWGNFARQYVFLRNNDSRSYEQMRAVFGTALDGYLQNGANITMGDVDPNAAAGMMQRVADLYGWETYRKFFRVLLNGEATSSESFVDLLSRAAGQDLRPLFSAWRWP